MRRKHWRGGRGPSTSGLSIAFGLGLMLALICSPRLVLFVVAVALIYIGTGCRW